MVFRNVSTFKKIGKGKYMGFQIFYTAIDEAG
jgi:hypothetical protein